MTNAEKFIDLVGKLYNLNEKQILQMQNNIPEIDAEFSKYTWDDIKNKTNLFYARKNDKSRPRVCQILALLESDPKITPYEPEPEYEPEPVYKPIPTTKIWSIQGTFDKLVDILTAGGVLPDRCGNYTNTRSIVNPDTDLPVLNPMQWLGWRLADAKNNRPDIFAPFPNANTLEQLALAIQNNLITFKVRDWAKLAKKGGNQ